MALVKRARKKDGTFKKGQAKTALVRRAPAQKHRRRSNPSVPILLANPQRSTAMVLHRGEHQPVRRRRPKNRAGLRAHNQAPIVVRRRRSNPERIRVGSLSLYVRLGLFGGAGIMAARIGGYLYTTHLAKHVRGNDVDPKSWRAIMNEALRLLAMGLTTYGVSRTLSKLRVCKPADCVAFLVGGMAETGRQAFGVVIQRVSPTTDRGRYGLDGEGEDVPGYIDEANQVWIRGADGQYHQAQFNGMGAVMDEEEFQEGMGAVMEEDEFYEAL